MNFETFVHEHPKLTTGAALAAGLVVGMRAMGAKLPRTTGKVGRFVWSHPVIAALGVVALAAGTEKILAERGLIATGAVPRQMQRAQRPRVQPASRATTPAQPHQPPAHAPAWAHASQRSWIPR